MTVPKVSVIIPNYNYGKYVSFAIDSVLNQTYPNIEVIVVDDGSKDNSKEILEGYGDKIKTIFQQNAGVSEARNNGVRESSGEFIAFLDADDIWMPEKIDKQMSRFAEDKALGLVNCGVEEILQTGEHLRFQTDGSEGWVAEKFLLFQTPTFAIASAGLIPRDIFKEVGGFDKELSTSADWDFGYRVASRYRIGIVHEPLVKYRIHGSNMHGNISLMERDMLLGYEKAFSQNDQNLIKIKRTAYGTLYQILAGSYFRAGNYMDFVRTATKSLLLKPSSMLYFIKFPLRQIK